ncbi:MAG: hypothetical protein E7379_04315 [Clostridiales bacterium]|nr:hypothetical protein [Clostridiales bacterium]
MQKENVLKLKKFKNAYCDVIYCGLGEYLDISGRNYNDILKKMTREDIQLISHYAVLKNLIAGVGEVNLKVPVIGVGVKFLEKYGLNGREILEAGYVNNLSTKDLIGERYMLEIEDLNDYNGIALSDISSFCATTETPIVVRFGQSLESVGQIVGKFGLSPASLLEDYGFLDRECYLYGMNYIDKDDQILLSNYNPTLILSPKSDGEEGKGAINLYNLIYHRLKFCFSSGKCYNIDMFKEGYIAILNTNNLMNKGRLVDENIVLDALQSEKGSLEIDFDQDKKFSCIFEESARLENDEICKIKNELENKIKTIINRLKGEN